MAGRREGGLGGMEGPDGGGAGSGGAHVPSAKGVWAQDSRPKARVARTVLSLELCNGGKLARAHLACPRTCIC